MRLLPFLLLFALTSDAQGVPAPAVPPVSPIWFTLMQESVTTNAILPAGATYRLGNAANNCWSPSVTVSAAASLSPVDMGVANQPFPFSDPCPGVVKELDVQETPASQLVILSDSTLSPASWGTLVPPLGGPPPLANGSHTVIFTNFQDTASSLNALMLALVNAPSGGGAQTWEGTQMQLSIDGTVLLCTYGQQYADGVFTLTCTVPLPATQ